MDNLTFTDLPVPSDAIDRILLVGESPSGEDWRQTLGLAPQVELTTMTPAEALASSLRFPLAVVCDGLNTSNGHQLLGHLKNLLSERVLALNPREGGWDALDFIALGFVESGTFSFENNSFHVYSYNLSSYNRKREWNNPRFWANPENFYKYRW